MTESAESGSIELRVECDGSHDDAYLQGCKDGAAAERERFRHLVTPDLLRMLAAQGSVSQDWAQCVADLLEGDTDE